MKKHFDVNTLKCKVFALLNNIRNDENSDKVDFSVVLQSGMLSYSTMLMNDVLKYIILEASSGDYFSEEDLSKDILQICCRSILSEKDDETIFKEIMRLINSKPKKFFCIIPIHGIELTYCYNFGIVSLYPSSMKTEVIRSSYNKDMSDFFLNSKNKIGNFDNEDFATINVLALSSQRAVEIAIYEINKTLNVIKFLFNGIGNLYQIGIGKKTETMFDNEFIVASNEYSKGSMKHPFKFLPMPANLNNLNKNGKKFVEIVTKIQSKIYKKQKTTPLERSLFNSVNLIASALYTDDYEVRMIKLMSAIESLVEQKTFNQSITDQVCERTALLLGKDLKLRTEIYNTMIKLYNKRSILSHGDTVRITKYDVDYLFNKSRNLCFLFLDRFDEFNDSNKKEKNKLKEYILKLKLS
ncbi:HEPN domain-containing protein [Apilactobacillus xinyiensis]|uniref:HEPN domain-containing protein n=1 Tax=Apilactobacillus xinyiensis TaxID=2841032 RepID=UPI001C7CF719|nr:HEPN domain-containing protein [Apilactobacillus xinyiensis]MCL0312268.1 HEPN domain-containing protein [Apilactobacillus xinyiensis]